MIVLPSLPYPHAALAPTMSAETLGFHHDKHHAAYVKKANELADAEGLAGNPLEEIIAKARKFSKPALFNNAAQCWNHAFFWESMSPEPGKPDEALASAIDAAFESHAKLKKAFVEEGAGHFGSGWVWLSSAGGKLKLTTTHDAETLATGEHGQPILVCDVWEHAYYLDKQNNRAGYLGAWFDKLANWEFASTQFGGSDPFRYPAK